MNTALLSLQPVERLRCELLLRALDDHKEWPAAIQAARAAERFVMGGEAEIGIAVEVKPVRIDWGVVLGDEAGPDAPEPASAPAVADHAEPVAEADAPPAATEPPAVASAGIDFGVRPAMTLADADGKILGTVTLPAPKPAAAAPDPQKPPRRSVGGQIAKNAPAKPQPKPSPAAKPGAPAELVGDAALIRKALDRGLGPTQIAKETGLPPKRVANVMYRHKWRAGDYVPPAPAPTFDHPPRMARTPEPIAFLMARDYQVLTVPGGYKVDSLVLSPRQLIDKANQVAKRMGKVKTWTVRDLNLSADAGGASR